MGSFQLPEVIALVNPSGEMLYASPSSAQVLGYPPEELVGRSTFELIHPHDWDRTRHVWRELEAKPVEPRQLKARIRHKDGRWCWMTTNLSSLLERYEVRAIVIHCRKVAIRRDSNGRSRMGEGGNSSNPELEHFACAVAHDLRDHLRTISIFTELLVNEAHLDARGRETAKIITNGVTQMSGLFEGLYTLALHGADVPVQPLDLGRILEQVLVSLLHEIRSSGALVTIGPLPRVQGNENELTRLLQNLIGNAIKYRGKAPCEIHVDAKRVGPDWVIGVRDNGVGIAREHHQSVFQMLNRLHGPEIPGAGMGLAICKRIVEKWGGSISVESDPGQGAVFSFTIPSLRRESRRSGLAQSNGNISTPLANRVVKPAEQQLDNAALSLSASRCSRPGRSRKTVKAI